MQGGRFSFLLFTFISFVFISNIVQADTFKSVDEILVQADSIALSSNDSAVNFLINRIDQRGFAKPSLFRLYSKAGELSFENQFYETSENYFNLALEFVNKSKNKEGFVNTLLDLGRIQRRLGNYEKALKYDMEALSIIENSDDKKKRALVYNYIGIDYYRYHNFDDAILNFNRSLEIRHKIEDSIGIADCYNNLGMVYDDKGDTANAMAHYKEALIVYEDQDELDGIAASYNNIAGLYYQQNNFTMVMDYMLKALRVRRKEGDKRKLSFTLLNIASLYFSKNNIEKSIELNLEGLKLAKEIGAKSQKKIAYEGLSDAYFAKGDLLNAYEYHVLYTSVKDSIFEANKSRAIAEMQAKYETEKKEIENQLLKNENKVKSRNQIILIVVVVGLFVLILMLIYYLRLRDKNLKQQKALARIELAAKEKEKQSLEDKVFAEKQINRLQKEKHEDEIRYKNKQLANSSLNLISKNEVLHELKAKIKNPDIKCGSTADLISFINQNTDMNSDWKKFRVDFDKIHPGFFDRLNQSYPDLSETFVKICAFLRIDLTSKEIAELLHVSLSAVNKNRQRLRKKLQLEAEADLSGFLKQI